MVDVAHGKNTELSRIPLGADGSSVGSGVNVDVQLIHSLHLEYTLRRSGAKESEVVLPRIQRELHPVECPLHRAEAEVRDEAIRNSCLDHGCPHRIGGFDFCTIKIFESPEFQCCRSEMLEVHERLLHKAIGLVCVVVVCSVIAAAQSELALGNCYHGIIRHAKNGRLLSFDKPVKVLSGLADSHSEQRVPQTVIAIPRVALKPVPSFRACPPVDGNLQRTQLVFCRSGTEGEGRRGNLRIGGGRNLSRLCSRNIELARGTATAARASRLRKGRLHLNILSFAISWQALQCDSSLWPLEPGRRREMSKLHGTKSSNVVSNADTPSAATAIHSASL
jgi:hypothetical protein